MWNDDIMRIAVIFKMNRHVNGCVIIMITTILLIILYVHGHDKNTMLMGNDI